MSSLGEEEIYTLHICCVHTPSGSCRVLCVHASVSHPVSAEKRYYLILSHSAAWSQLRATTVCNMKRPDISHVGVNINSVWLTLSLSSPYAWSGWQWYDPPEAPTQGERRHNRSHRETKHTYYTHFTCLKHVILVQRSEMFSISSLHSSHFCTWITGFSLEAKYIAK